MAKAKTLLDTVRETVPDAAISAMNPLALLSLISTALDQRDTETNAAITASLIRPDPTKTGGKP